MEWYVILILVLAAPFMLLPVALIWYINIAGTMTYFKERAKAKEAHKVAAHVKAKAN